MTPESRRAYHRDYYDRYERHVRGLRPLQDATAAREHVQECIAAGMSHIAIGAAAGVSQSTISRLMNTPGVRLQEGVATRLLAVQPQRPVTTIGITRRVRALAALGWTTTQIVAASGAHVDTVKAYRRGERRVEVHAGARGIVTAYERLSMRTAPQGGRYERAAASRARTEARRGGWAPPLAWDDSTIDDPTAEPQGVGVSRGRAIDTIRELADMGLTRDAIAARLGITRNAVDRAYERAGRTAA